MQSTQEIALNLLIFLTFFKHLSFLYGEIDFHWTLEQKSLNSNSSRYLNKNHRRLKDEIIGLAVENWTLIELLISRTHQKMAK